MKVISKSEPVARKNYGCDACVWIAEYPECIDDCEMSFADKRIVVKARQNGWRVMKGEKHLQFTVVSCENTLVSLRVIKAINEICHKYDLYPDEDLC